MLEKPLRKASKTSAHKSIRANPSSPADKPSTPAPPPHPDRRRRLLPIGILVTLWFLFGDLVSGTGTHTLTYTQFIKEVSAGKVQSVSITPDGEVDGRLKSGETFTSAIPTAVPDRGLAARLESNNVQVVTVAQPPSILGFLVSFSPLLVFIGLFLYMVGVRAVSSASSRRSSNLGPRSLSPNAPRLGSRTSPDTRVDIPIHADVICIDGDAGTSKALIVDPVQRRLTQVVVREHRLAGSERLVPFGLVDETSEDVIWLSCTRDELHGLDDFIEAHFVDVTYATPTVGPPYEWSKPVPMVVSERIPKGELVLRRRSAVEASDGSVGHVQSLVADTTDDHITHVVLRTHRFLSRQEVAVPETDVERFLPDHVFLRLSRRDVESLPHVPYLLPTLRPADEELVPEGPTETGVGSAEVDASHLEGAHLLADEVAVRLRARGFTDEQILDWAKAFLRSEHSGGDPEFLAWISKRDQAPKPRGGPSHDSFAENRRQPDPESALIAGDSPALVSST
jgi:hypothetical protein